jgi:hypothetical protein
MDKPPTYLPPKIEPRTYDKSDYCPTCGQLFTSSCRCMIGNRWCANGHAWHTCKVHNVQVLGTGHGVAGRGKCSCGTPDDSAPQPDKTVGMNAAHFVFDLGDKVTLSHDPKAFPAAG